MKHKTFIEYLEGKCLKTYIGTKDQFEDYFDDWLANLDNQDLIDYGEKLVKELQSVNY